MIVAMPFAKRHKAMEALKWWKAAAHLAHESLRQEGYAWSLMHDALEEAKEELELFPDELRWSRPGAHR